jgi:iron complex outermembrane receptor protein
MKQIFLTRRILSVILCLMLASFTFGQNISGTVSNAKSGLPLEGAIVMLNGNTAETDKAGQFSLPCGTLPANLSVHFIGFQDYNKTIGDCNAQLQIALLPLENNLSAVDINDSFAVAQNLKVANASTTLGTEDLNRASGLNLQDALNNVAGVNMQNREPWGGDRIIIRGYMPNLGNSVNTSNGFGYQAFINNIPITDAIGNTILDDVDMSNFGKVDVIKGPASPLYGSYIGGSVNLFTPLPTQTGFQEQVIGGSYGLFRSNTSLQIASEKSLIWINYGHQIYMGFRPSDGSAKDFASFAGTFYVSPKNTISTYFSYNNSYESLAGELDSFQVYGRKAVSDTNYMFNASHVKMEGFRAGTTDNYRINNHFGIQTTVFATSHNLDQAIAHGFTAISLFSFGGRTAFTYQNHGEKVAVDGTLGTSFQKTTETVNGVFILPFRPSPFNSSTPIASYTDQQNYAMNYNVFTQWAFIFHHDVTATVGGSMNFAEFGIQNMLVPSTHLLYNEPPMHLYNYSPVFTPNVSVAKVFKSKISAYANVGMGYTPAGLSQILKSTGDVTTGLKPETAIQYEIGSKGNLAGGKLVYQLAIYDLDITNRFVTEYANAVSFTTNAGEQKNMGVELNVAYSAIQNKDGVITLLRPWISYTYDNATYTTFQNFAKSSTGNDTLVADYSGKKVAAIAPNIFNFGVDVDTKFGLYAHVTYRYVDKAPITFDNQHYMSAYSLLGARIGYKQTFGRLTMDVFAGADNLLGSVYYTSIFVGGTIGPLAQANDPYVTGGGGDGYILPAPYSATFYGGVKLSVNLGKK